MPHPQSEMDAVVWTALAVLAATALGTPFYPEEKDRRLIALTES